MDKLCSVCGEKRSSSLNGIWYCNKHWQRMYSTGTTDLRPKMKNKYIIEGDVAYIFYKDKKIIVDTEDLNKLRKYSWCLSKTGYSVANVKNKVTKMHIYIIGKEFGKVTDHINGNCLDNRKSNLRICTQQENSFNHKINKNNSSGVSGVSKTSFGKWRVRFMINGKEKRYGHYESKEKAIIVANKIRSELFGEYMRTL